MKKSLFLVSVIAVLFTGCAKKYVDVKTDNAATLQLVPQSKSLIFSDVMLASISDYSKGCQDMVELGYFSTDNSKPSKSVKIPIETPLLIKASYTTNGFVDGGTEDIDFVLTPKKNEHYIIEYVKIEKNGRAITDFYVYIKNGKKALDIPKERIRDFNYRECM